MCTLIFFLMTFSYTLALEGSVSNKQCQFDRPGNYIVGVYCIFMSPYNLQHPIRYYATSTDPFPISSSPKIQDLLCLFLLELSGGKKKTKTNL